LCPGVREEGYEAELRGFAFVEDGATASADGYAWFDFLGAGGTFLRRLGILEPGFVELGFAGGAAVEVGDEHGIVRAFPLACRSKIAGYQVPSDYPGLVLTFEAYGQRLYQVVSSK